MLTNGFDGKNTIRSRRGSAIRKASLVALALTRRRKSNPVTLGSAQAHEIVLGTRDLRPVCTTGSHGIVAHRQHGAGNAKAPAKNRR